VNLCEILAELPKLNHEERRQLARRLFELEDQAAQHARPETLREILAQVPDVPPMPGDEL